MPPKKTWASQDEARSPELHHQRFLVRWQEPKNLDHSVLPAGALAGKHSKVHGVAGIRMRFSSTGCKWSKCWHNLLCHNAISKALWITCLLSLCSKKVIEAPVSLLQWLLSSKWPSWCPLRSRPVPKFAGKMPHLTKWALLLELHASSLESQQGFEGHYLVLLIKISLGKLGKSAQSRSLIQPVMCLVNSRVLKLISLTCEMAQETTLTQAYF